ncbi:MAG TPA: HDOD domain-containing protein [Methylothermaceae bacterium]|nr:HDOD domain-containing protein [Methylothermaceae bacterium]
MHFTDEQEFLDHLLDEIRNDRINLPTLPEVALKVRRAVESGNATASQLAQMIGEDAGLSARLLQVANSPLYRGRAEITNLQMAVMRLGYDTVRSLITSLALKQVFTPDSPLLEKYFQTIWQTSVDVAAISRALSSLCPHLESEQAMLAGLIHQIGKLPILVLANQTPDLADNQALLDRLITALHPRIGEMILATWHFPETLRLVVKEYHDWYRRPDMEQADYVDLIQVAYLENLTSKGEEPPVDVSRIPAFSRLGLAPDIEVIEMEGVAETRQMFA